MSRYINPTPFIQTINGSPISGAKLYFYETGTTTLKTIYSDSGFTTSTTNPQVADSSGRYSGDIFLDGIYKVVQKDASDVTIWTKDPVGDVVAGQFELWTNDNTYALNEIVLGSDGNYYISLASANQGNNPTTDTTNWELFYLNRMNYKIATAVDDDDIDGSNILTFPSDGDYSTMTGTQQIDEILTEGVGRVIWLQAGSIRQLTHHATNLILLSGANITTAVGDVMCLHEYATGDFRMLNYERVDGKAITETGITQGTAVASTSGTSIDFTGIPSGVKRIIISFDGVSTTGTSPMAVQLGDSGGPETTGYLGTGSSLGASALVTVNSTTDFLVARSVVASVTYQGSVILSLVDSFTWACSSQIGANATNTYLAQGSKTLSAELDRVRITTQGGSDTFDAGTINIQYES